MGRSCWTLRVFIQHVMFIFLAQFNVFSTGIAMRTTSFSCLNRTAGFYADLSTNCKLYHTCDEYGNKFTYYCPKETAFRQDALICDHAHLVQCQGHNATEYEEANEDTDSSCVRNSQKSHFSYTTEPVIKMNNKMEQQSVFNFKQTNKNASNKTESKIMNTLYSLNYFNFTTNAPIERTKTQYNNIATTNQYRASFSIQNPSLYDKNKLNKKPRMEQQGSNQRTSDLKQSSNTFSGIIRNAENNAKDYQSTKSSNNFLQPPLTNYRNYPYLETLKSIQKNTKIPSTTIGIRATSIVATATELPVHALTLSLKPLVPGELEYDPYYPRVSTTTESYYTPMHSANESLYDKTSTSTTWSISNFELPSVLPDLNFLQDIVDRRKLLYIAPLKYN
ncbi:uncharacterized protein LOC108629987 [Ceratina calcarata]|uniref:Uncharacterized protein LOC108629987 n=1 Tax=Ceratina calcarata TaxID=156304 RepID=A0AAJ7JBC2_9HYME|nr:uncharacterized protein LOC108629987 [Ceratina calcarata]